MTDEKALELLRGLIIDTSHGVKCIFDTSDFVRTCEKALEKQIPKKWGTEEDYKLDIYYKCPICKECFMPEDGTPKDNSMNYCPNCGQRLDYTEEQEDDENDEN